jgi:hypothetical protein
MDDNKGIDITKNVRITEWLKSELLTAIAMLYEILAIGPSSTKEDVLDGVANIIMITYLLGRRLGLSYDIIDLEVSEKLKLSLVEDHQIERWYGDISELKSHIEKRENRSEKI